MATGGGPLQELSLSQCEERVVDLTNVNLSINPVGKTLGISDQNDRDTEKNMDEPAPNVAQKSSPVATTVETAAPLTTAKKNNKATAIEEKRLDLLAEQLSNQREMLSVQRNIEKHTYKMYEIKKRKLELLEKSAEEEAELRQMKLQIAKKKLEQLNDKNV